LQVGAAGTNGAAVGELAKLDFSDTACEEAVAEMDAIICLTRSVKVREGPPPKKRKGAIGGADPVPVEYNYATLAADARQHYEDLNDWDKRAPLLANRKGCMPGRFDSYRLRLVQNLALTCGGGGLTLVDQQKLFHMLDAWDRTKPGQPVDAGHFLGIRDSFSSPNAFINGLRDDIDNAVEDEGWMKVDLEESGETFQVIFRPALELALGRMRKAKSVKLWSGGDRPAPPTEHREEPMDGDAFRRCETDVVKENGADSFVLAIHAFSDASRVSDSGGAFVCGLGGAQRCGAGIGASELCL